MQRERGKQWAGLEDDLVKIYLVKGLLGHLVAAKGRGHPPPPSWCEMGSLLGSWLPTLYKRG